MANYRILVVDDIDNIHEDFRKILLPESNTVSDKLEQMNSMILGKKTATELPPFDIDSAYQGNEAVQFVEKSLLEKKPYAVAFVDVQMPPGMDGVDTIEKIWKLDPDIQIVICTAYAHYSWNDLHKRFGDTDRLFILKKPFDQIEIVNLASSLTHRWNLNQSVAQLISKPKAPPLTTKKMDLAPSSLSEAIETLKHLNEKLKSDQKKTDS